MRFVKTIILATFLALIVFGLYSIFSSGNDIVSPIPEDKGIKIIPLED